MLNIPLQLVTCKILSVSATKGGGKMTNGSSCSFYLTFGEEQLQTQVSTGDTSSARDTYSNPVEYYPSSPCHLTEQVFK